MSETRRRAGQRLADFKPLKLKDWIGKGALRPPEDGLAAPDFAKLESRTPKRLPDGRPVDSSRAPDPALFEGLLG